MRTYAAALVVTFSIACAIPLTIIGAINGSWPHPRAAQYVVVTAGVTVLLPLMVVLVLLRWRRRRDRHRIGTDVAVAGLVSGLLGGAIYVVSWATSIPLSDPVGSILRSLTSIEAVVLYPLFALPGIVFAVLSRVNRSA